MTGNFMTKQRNIPQFIAIYFKSDESEVQTRIRKELKMNVMLKSTL